jgi:hypothetical protein
MDILCSETYGAMPEQPADILLKGALRSKIYLKIKETNLQHKIHKMYFSINYCECANDQIYTQNKSRLYYRTLQLRFQHKLETP